MADDGITQDTFELSKILQLKIVPLTLVNKIKVITPFFDILSRLTTKLDTEVYR